MRAGRVRSKVRVHRIRTVLVRVMEGGEHGLDGGEANDDGFGCMRSMATRARGKRWDVAAAHPRALGVVDRPRGRRQRAKDEADVGDLGVLPRA